MDSGDSFEFLLICPATLNKILNFPPSKDINTPGLLAEAGQGHLGRAHAIAQ